MAGLVPAIHVLLWTKKKDADARDKRGHDGAMFYAIDINPVNHGLVAGLKD